MRVQSVRTIDGEVLTLVRVLDPRMVGIYRIRHILTAQIRCNPVAAPEPCLRV